MSRPQALILMVVFLLASCTSTLSTANPTVTPNPIPTTYPTPPELPRPKTVLVDRSEGWIPGEISRIGNGAIYDISLSPNADVLVVTTTLGVWIYSMVDAQVILYQEGEPLNSWFDISDIAWSPDGSMLAVGKQLNGVWVWETETWSLLTELGSTPIPEGGRIYDLPGIAWSPDGRYLAVGSGNKAVWVWDSTSNGWEDWSNYKNQQIGLTWAPDGRLLMHGPGALFDVRTGEYVQPLANRWTDGCCSKVSWSPDWEHVLIMFDLGGSVIDIDDGDYAFWAGIYPRFSWSPDGSFFATTFGHHEKGQILWVYKSATHNLYLEIKLEHPITALTWTSDGDLLALGMKERQFVLWNVYTNDILLDLTNEFPQVSNTVTWTENGQKLFFARWNQVAFWDLAENKRILAIDHRTNIANLVLSPDEKAIAAYDFETGVLAWDVDTGQLIFELETPTSAEYLTDIKWSWDNTLLSAGDLYGYLYIWNTLTGELEFSTSNGTTSVYSRKLEIMSWSPTDDVLVFKFSGELPVFLSLESEPAAVGKRCLRDASKALEWSPDGRFLAFALVTKAFRICDAGSGATLFEYSLLSDEIKSITWSPDNRVVAALTSKNTLYVWDVATTNVIAKLQIEKDFEMLRWSPNSKLIAGRVWNNFVLIIDPYAGTIHSQFQAHADWIGNLGWSLDSTQLYTSSSDGTFRVWEIFP